MDNNGSKMIQSNQEVKNYGEAKLFDHSILEIFTKTNPPVHIITYGSTIAILMYVSFHQESIVISVYLQLIIFVSGFLFWTLFEYFMHRYIFHISSNTRFVKRMQYLLHGNHHEFPMDKKRLFMPPLPGLIIITVLFIVFYLLMGQYSFLFLSAMVLGYMVYSLMHYSMHAFKPPHMLRSLWKHHSLHHYKYPDKAYGVSSPLWDHIFGTMPSLKNSRQKDIHK